MTMLLWRHPRRSVLRAVATASVIALPAHADTPFYVETVHGAGEAGARSSLALDAQGTPHVTYWHANFRDLFYAVKTHGSWTIETVDDGDYVGLHSSVDVDTQGRPHVSYYDSTNEDLKYAVRTDGVWMTEVVDATDDVGMHTSLAVDSRGNPHVSYYDATNGQLKYAVKVDGFWTIETLNLIFDRGQYTSLALDADDQPHVSYYQATSGELDYAAKTALGWYLETIDDVGDVGLYGSLALDAQSNPHVSYYDATNEVLKHAMKTGGGWVVETIDAAIGSSSIALDPQGNPHVSYYSTQGTLAYAVKTAGNWTFETVDASGISAGPTSSLALDAQGNPYISYSTIPSVGDVDLRFADAGVHVTSPIGGERWIASRQNLVTWDGVGPIDIEISPDGGGTYTTLASHVSGGKVAVNVPAWTTTAARVRITRAAPLSTSESPDVFAIELEKITAWWQSTADSTGSVGAHSSLALGAEDKPHVTYYDGTVDDLVYAVKTGDVWQAEVVDTTGNVGLFTSLALDAQGDPHVSYYDVTDGDLEYAVKTEGSWSVETIDATGVVGLYTSLALDGAGDPHVSYYDSDNGDLKYATKTGGSWSVETIDATEDVGAYTSLALDARGDPHISYHDFTNSSLEYAVKSGATWSIETVDSDGFVGRHSSLALDAHGDAHISYYDHVIDDLKYAMKTDGSWTVETVDAVGNVGEFCSLALDAWGEPHISYSDGNPNHDLKYAVKKGATWRIETVATTGVVGSHTSLALDSEGNPHVSHYDLTGGDLEYASGAVEITSPVEDDVWPVGAQRAVKWDGLGTVDISLSVDGGFTYDPLAHGVHGGLYEFVVPHVPSRFCRVRLERRVEANTFSSWCYPLSIAESDSFFTIETTIELLAMAAGPANDERGIAVSWETDPGPDDLHGYRLERRRGESVLTLVSRTTETSHHDPDGRAGDRYGLFAINGLGDELYLGETRSGQLPVAGAIVAYPVPFRDGEMTIHFGNTFGAGGQPLETDVAIYDVSGRRVRTVARRRTFDDAVGHVSWDGRNDQGTRASSGVYFVRVEHAQGGSSRQVMVVR